MDKKTKIIIAILVILVIIISIYVGMLIIEDNNKLKSVSSNSSNILNENKIVETNTRSENVVAEENKTNNNSNEIISNNISNVTQNVTANVVGKEENDIREQENTQMSNDEKAIKLVEDKYGKSDDNIKYSIANKSGNEYYISASNIVTTQVIAWYKVDIDKGTVIQE